MSQTTLKIIKSKLYNVNYFKYPEYSIINRIKITNLNIYSKIIAKNKILVYGNYDIVITYNNIIYKNYTRIDLVEYKKKSFHKVLNYNILEFDLIECLQTKVELLSKPLAIYSLSKLPFGFFSSYNLCKISLFLSISVNLYKNESSIQFEDINSNTSQNVLTKSIDLNNNILLPYNKLLSEEDTINKNSISISIFKGLYNFNSINDNIYIPAQNSSILPSNVQSVPPYNSRLYSYNKIIKQTVIEEDVILCKGYSEIFLEKNLTLSDPIKPIWKISKVMAKADITKIDISGEKAFANGFAYIDINYKTYLPLDIDAISGTIQYIHLSIPFSLCIDLVPDSNDKIKDSDYCKVSSINVSEVHNLSQSTTIDNETIYNEFTGQFIVQVTVLVTRTMKIYI